MSRKGYRIPHFVAIIREIETKTGVNADDARTAIESYIAIISNYLYDGKVVSIKGLGNLEVCKRRGGTFRNPKEGTLIEKEEALRVRFRPCAALKRLING